MAFYKRSIFLINPKFQLKFSLIVCGIVLIATLVYPFIIFEFFNILAQKSPAVAEAISSARSEFLVYLIVVHIFTTLLVFLFFIFLTHRIAGPMFKLKSHITGIKDGAPITPLIFRNGDYFQDIAQDINEFLSTITENHEADFEYVEEVTEYIDNLTNVVPDDKKPVLMEISRRLLEIKSRYTSK